MSIKVQITTLTGHKISATIAGNKAFIGRSTSCDVPVQDESLSRQHCLIEISDGVITITDLQSRNGVYIDGTRIIPNIKTPFAVFKQLTLGALDCLIEEIEASSGLNEIATNKDTFQNTNELSQEKQTKTTTRQPRTNKSTRPNKKVSAKSEKNTLRPFVLPVLILASAAYYILTDKKKPPTPSFNESLAESQSIKKANRAHTLSVIPKAKNDFKPDGVYIEWNKKANCSIYIDECKNLNLDQNFNEGIVKEESEVLVYFNAEKLIKNGNNENIKKDPNVIPLLIYKHLLPSSLMEEFYEKKVTQIHVVLLDESGKAKEVTRIHPAQYDPDKNPRTNLLTSLSDALNGQRPQDFIDQISKLVVKKNIIE